MTLAPAIPGLRNPVSPIVQGAMMLGSVDDPEPAYALFDAFFARGINTFDTAHVYGNGKVDRLLGGWIASRGNREKVNVLAKGAHHNADRRRVTPFDITADIHDCLARMKTDYLDLFVLHRDDPSAPVGPIVETLHQHREAGRILAYGGSNWTHERLAEANAYAKEHGLTPFAVSSPNFSLAAQHEEPWPECVSIGGPAGEAARAWYAQAGMTVIPWSSLAGGFFSGRFRRDNLDSFDSTFDTLAVRCYAREDNFQRLDRAETLSREKGLTLPQIALAYVVSQPFDVRPLVGCRTVEEIEQNLAALDVGLTPEEIAWLELRSDR